VKISLKMLGGYFVDSPCIGDDTSSQITSGFLVSLSGRLYSLNDRMK